MWAVHVCTDACIRHTESPTLLNSFAHLRRSIYQLAGLLPAELTDASVLRIMEALNAKFSTRLNFDASKILNYHHQAAGALATAA
jgi:hypothetical protein